jgi:branched-chain amino acid transport system ATP-binding protein
VSADALLKAEGLEAGYGAVTILRDFSLQVATGEVTALIGGNGAGKTTLMRTLAGLIAPRAGRITFESRDITAEPAHARVDAGISLIPEGRLVFPGMSVEENLRLGAIAPRARADTQRRLAEVYGQFPRLAERRAQSAITLSGGEQQMLAIGRGLMAGPRLVLLDEPTLGLAPIMVREVFAIIAELRAQGYTVLIAEQDVRHTLKIADRAYVVENGRVALSGSGRAVADNPDVRRAYMGL